MDKVKKFPADLGLTNVNLTGLPDVFPEKTLSKILGKSSVSLWRMRRKDPPDIPYLRISNGIYYLRADVEAFLMRSRVS